MALLLAVACDRRAPDGAPSPGSSPTPGPRSAAASPPGDQPSVLLVVVDTLRADRLPMYGHAAGKTPTLDRLAREAVVFDRAIAASASTVPSHASLFTSRFVRQHSVGFRNGGTRLSDEATLAEQFRHAGYATAAFISNVMLNHTTGLNRGFEIYDENLPEPEPNRPLYFERSAPLTTKRAVHWLETTGNRPVFLVVHYQDPHGPYTPPPRVLKEIPPGDRADEPTLPVNATQSGLDGLPAYQALPGLDHPSQYERRYAAEILYMDRWLGVLLRAFDEHRPSTGHIVVFTSDHGESMGEERHWFEHGHTSMPDVAHVPLLLRAPGLPPGRRSDPVSHVDVMPTLLELAHLPVPPGTAGVALGPHLRDGTAVPPRDLYCDLGVEAAVYDEGGLTRIRFPSLEAAERGDLAGADLQRYRWDSRDAWSEEPEAATVSPETKTYLDRTHPMRPAGGGLDADHVERLRALGYVEPETHP